MATDLPWAPYDWNRREQATQALALALLTWLVVRWRRGSGRPRPQEPGPRRRPSQLVVRPVRRRARPRLGAPQRARARRPRSLGSTRR